MSTENRLFEAVPVSEYKPKVGDVIYAVNDAFAEGISKTQRWKVEIVNDKKFAAFIKEYGITTILRPLSTPSEEKWISVKDRLPEFKPLESKAVLTINKGGHVDVLSFWQNSWYKDKVLDETEITHWMPLPSPPSA